MFRSSEFALPLLRTKRLEHHAPDHPFLLGAVTAVITNPLWLVRVRMFTTHSAAPNAYRGLWGK